LDGSLITAAKNCITLSGIVYTIYGQLVSSLVSWLNEQSVC